MQEVIYKSIDETGIEVGKVQQGGKVFVLTDENLAGLYLEKVLASLEKSGFSTALKVISPGEKSKTPKTYIELLEDLSKNSVTRKDGLLALGGGVIGDLGGFTAATYMRGIKFYQVPTSLLAMVDSAIGGKTGINLSSGKNLAGAFYLPDLILTDTSLLETLPKDEMENGMGEVAKYGILKGGNLLDSLRNSEPVDEIVKTCADIKIEITSEDFLDRGRRKLLNLGHTLGHAIEKLSDYDIKHGLAVAKGIAGITRIAIKEGWTSETSGEEILALLENLGFDTSIPYGGEEIYKAVLMDKKREGEVIGLVVPEEIGRPVIKEIELGELERILKS